MVELRIIRDNPDEVIHQIEKRNIDARNLVLQIIELDDERKQIQGKLDAELAAINSRSKEIGKLYQSGQAEQANELKQQVEEIKEASKKLKDELSDTEMKLQQALYALPNIPNETVPAGNSEEDNIVEYQVAEIPKLADTAKPHWELAEQYNLIDFATGVKVTGAGFPFYKGKGAKLQRALIQFFLDQASEAGYLEVQPPLLVNEESGYGTGQLPDKEGQMYHVTVDDFYLIPTSEVPLTNMYRDEIIQEEDLPIKLTGYTPCFRREAGSYGKDVRGLNRLHQFDKVELVQFAHPELSYTTLEEMKNHVENLLKQLELPYRILRLCAGDLGFTSAITFDFETYSAAQNRWLEVSSVSNFESFQSNRAKIRYRPKAVDGTKQKTELVHTLNGSALALPRILATLLENNQHEQGIQIPKVLVPYTKFEWIN